MTEPSQHLEAEAVAALAGGDLGRGPVLVEVLRRLGEHCSVCARLLESYPLAKVAERAGEPYRPGLERAARRATNLEAERRRAGDLIDELVAEPTLGRAMGLVTWSPRFATAGLASVLVDHSALQLEENAGAAHELAVLAVEVSSELDEERYDRALVENLRFAARVRLAEALRAAGEIGRAESELDRAEAHRLRGSGERYLEAEASLARARLSLSRGELSGVRDAITEVEEWALQARLPWYAWDAIRLGAALARAEGDPARSATISRVLAASIRGHVPAAQERAVRLDLVATLVEAGDFDAGWAELERLGSLVDESAGAGFLGRRSFWSARVLEGLGRHAEAAREYEAAWRRLQAEGLGPEAVRAAVRLLALQASRGGETDRLVDDLPDLLAIEDLPAWARVLVVGILEDVWRGDRRFAESLQEAQATAERYLLAGPRDEPPRHRH